MNPADPWAWIGLAGDLIDVAVPFVGGLGEATRAANAALNVTEALDDVHDASKVIDDLAEAAVKCDGLCFVAGTEVLVKDGTKSIECIQIGDLVWAWDEATDTVALKEVVETYINETDELIHVFVSGQEILTTPSHPFYSPVKGWTEAVHLRAGDILVLVNGEYVVVEKVQHEILETPVRVYNFQVKDYHTYYVTEAGVLVHNKCFRGELMDYTGLAGDGMDAHHIFPQTFRDRFSKIGIDVDNPQYGAWVDSREHSWFSYEYNQEWVAFFGDNPTRAGAMELAKGLAGKYGYKVYI